MTKSVERKEGCLVGGETEQSMFHPETIFSFMPPPAFSNC